MASSKDSVRSPSMKRLLSSTSLRVSTSVDETLELAVRELELVDPEIRQRHRRRDSDGERASLNAYHSRFGRLFVHQCDRQRSNRMADVYRNETGFRDAHAIRDERNLGPADRSRAEAMPLAVEVRIVPDRHFSASGGRIDVEVEPGLADATDLLGGVSARPFGEPHGLERTISGLESFDLRDHFAADSLRLARAHELPDADPCHGEEENDDRNEDCWPAPGSLCRPRELCVRGGEIRPQCGRILIPRRRILRECALDDRVHVCRRVGPRVPHGRRLIAQDRRDYADVRGAAEGASSGEHLVQDGAERENVGPGVDRATFRLLRRHVGGRAHDNARLGRHRADGRFGRRQLDQFREPEVEHLRASVAGDHDVGRLDVAMDDAAAVGDRKRAGDLHRVIQCRGNRDRPLGEQPIERRAVDQLHRDERRPASSPIS